MAAAASASSLYRRYRRLYWISGRREKNNPG
jgi:hypothetical protein